AVLFRAVKGGGKLPQPIISAIFKVHLSLFSLLIFFINHLTLSLVLSSKGGTYQVYGDFLDTLKIQ
ncbi:hypothetical protein, partial [Anaerosporobacter faecicola]|uniref:hypothetical protein n=1 Tax=Anaerosporobacter faecicola TaxID=2718714 RepID=UPI001A9BF457